MTNEELIAEYTAQGIAISYNERGNSCATMRTAYTHIYELLTDGTWRNIVSKAIITDKEMNAALVSRWIRYAS